MLSSIDLMTGCNLFTKLFWRAARTGPAARMRSAARGLTGAAVHAWLFINTDCTRCGRVGYCEIRAGRGPLTGVLVSEGAGYREDGVETLEDDGVEDHLAVTRLDGQIGQVTSEFRQLLKRVEGVDLLKQ